MGSSGTEAKMAETPLMATTKNEAEMAELTSKAAKQQKLREWGRWRTAEQKPPGSKTKPGSECGVAEVMCRAVFSGDGVAVWDANLEDSNRG